MAVEEPSVPAILRELTLGSAEWKTRGVLRPQAMGPGTVTRIPPAAEMSAVVDLYWIVRLNFAPGESMVVETLPHPCVNVVVATGESLVHGPLRGRFTKTLSGRGTTVSARLRPGAFHLLTGRPAWRLVGTTLSFDEAFGAPSAPLERRMAALAEAEEAEEVAEVAEVEKGNEADDHAMVGELEVFLLAHLPRPDGAALALLATIDDAVGRIAAERELLRVEELAQATGMSRRALERLFRQYVGPSPKWVIRQYRLQAAADQAGKGGVTNWSRLASDLGYADQAHFNRDFRAVLGTTPAEFMRQSRPAAS